MAVARPKRVAEYTGFPNHGRPASKTLHPKIHGGLLGRRGMDDAVMREHGIEPIDLLAVNLYPFCSDRCAGPDCSYEDAVENIDIGGPAMVRARGKKSRISHRRRRSRRLPRHSGRIGGESGGNAHHDAPALECESVCA